MTHVTNARIGMFALALLAQSVAFAEDTPRSVTEPASEGGLSEDGLQLTHLKLPWTEPSGRGVSIGFDNGAFGQGFGQGLRVRVPFSRHFGFALRGLSVFADEPSLFHWQLGGRLELFGQSPVLLNVMRLYGGGGIQAFYPVRTDGSRRTAWGGGGHFGFEFFLSPRTSFFLEVGGTGSASRLTTGSTIMAGMHFYPF